MGGKEPTEYFPILVMKCPFCMRVHLTYEIENATFYI